MKQNKIAIIVTTPIVVASLILALLLDIYVKSCGFWTNVFLGVFGSALLGLITAIINYITERKNTIDTFFVLHLKVVANFQRFQKNKSSIYRGDTTTPIGMILSMAEFDYFPFDEAFKNINFVLCNKKKRERIYEKMYKPIDDLRDKVSTTALKIDSYQIGNILTEQRKRDFINLMDDCSKMDIAASIPLKKRETVQLSHVIKKLHDNEEEFYNTYMKPKKRKQVNRS